MKKVLLGIVIIFWGISYANAIKIKDPVNLIDYYALCKMPENSEIKAYCIGFTYAMFLNSIFNGQTDLEGRRNNAAICRREYYTNKVTSEEVYKKTIKLLNSKKLASNIYVTLLPMYFHEAFPYPKECEKYFM